MQVKSIADCSKDYHLMQVKSIADCSKDYHLMQVTFDRLNTGFTVKASYFCCLQMLSLHDIAMSCVKVLILSHELNRLDEKIGSV